MDYDYDESSTTMVMEQEIAEENEEEKSNAIEKNTLDEVALGRLRELPSTRVAKSRIGTKFTCMDQMVLLEKNDVKRLKDNPQDDLDCYTHQCMDCNMFLTFPWKMKLKLIHRPVAGTGLCHAAHVQRRLTNYCNPDR